MCGLQSRKKLTCGALVDVGQPSPIRGDCLQVFAAHHSFSQFQDRSRISNGPLQRQLLDQAERIAVCACDEIDCPEQGERGLGGAQDIVNPARALWSADAGQSCGSHHSDACIDFQIGSQFLFNSSVDHLFIAWAGCLCLCEVCIHRLLQKFLGETPLPLCLLELGKLLHPVRGFLRCFRNVNRGGRDRQSCWRAHALRANNDVRNLLA
mmetsp:Transcript_6892/g.14787  ORF Transcript_6892/g.14787 Transcript_6892/m.14787 type:complete len:209 (-) Transcript_6892:517-1143(-)